MRVVAVAARQPLEAAIGINLTTALLPSALTSDSGMTSSPESLRAQEVIEERLPGAEPVDELLTMRSERLRVTDPEFAARVGTLARELRRQADVERVTTFGDPGGELLVSRDRHATLLAVVLSDDPQSTSVEHLIATTERANASDDFAVHVVGEHTISHDFQHVSEQDLRKGELQFGCRRPCSCCCLCSARWPVPSFRC